MRNNKQPILGILGGMGPDATVSFYDKIVKHTCAEKDQEHIRALIYSDTAIPDRTTAILSNDPALVQAVVDEFNDSLKLFADAGVDSVVLTCNTLTYFIPFIESKVKVINIVDETVKAVKERAGERREERGESEREVKVGIMATDGTVQMGLYHKALERVGLVPVSPSKDMQAKTMEIIYSQVKKTGKGNIEDFNMVLEHLLDQGCEYIITGCTDLSWFVQDNDFPQRVDSVDALVKASIKMMGKQYKEYSPHPVLPSLHYDSPPIRRQKAL
ncbi:MAG: amino acid racemase [Alphaproteobacteria bacterium]|nr:amino acid racemase [Alphaproteobacteria bacterium]